MPPRVGFFCPVWSRPGAMQVGWSDYWRLLLPAVALHRNGWDVVLGRNIGPGSDGRLSLQDPDGDWWGDRDVLVFHRWMSKDAPRLIRQAREAGQVMINDLDDHFWDLPPGHPAIWATNPERERDYNRDNYRATFPESSLITVSTPALADVSANWGPDVRVVRNYIDLDAWSPSRPPGTHYGWVGSTAGREHDLEILRTAVVPWLRDRGLPFYHGGAVPGEPKMADILGYRHIVSRQTVGPLTYPRLWDPLRVAVCPLGDHPFSDTKSWVKPLEACARGIPFIASPQAEYRALGVGCMAAQPADWVRHLEALEDPALHASHVTANRACANDHALAWRWRAWTTVLDEAVQPKEREVAI